MAQTTFETLSDAITFAFRQEQTSLLSLDKICEVLESPNLFLNSKSQGIIPCSSITRRRISSTLSSSDLFVKAGPPRTCLWAIRPHNPSFISDGAIAASIEQMLLANGPLTIEQFVEKTELSGAHLPLFERFLNEHQTEFSKNIDETWWFINEPIPIKREFENLCQAITIAFEPFINGATVEEIHWYLCLSTVGGKPIARRSISRELSRRQDLFIHLSRAKYGLMPTRRNPIQTAHSLPKNSYFNQNNENNIFQNVSIPEIPKQEEEEILENSNQQPLENPIDNITKINPQDDDDWDPFSFFNNDFRFDF